MNEVVTDIFAAIEDDPAVALNLRIRADLMIALHKHIDQQQLTQVQAAQVMNVSQPRVSNLMGGKIDLFSVDTLIAMANAAGLDVSVKVRRARRASRTD